MPNVELPHEILYQTLTHVPVKTVARSLIANEALIEESMKLLEQIFVGLRVEVVNIRVGALSNSSPLKELLYVALVLNYQDKLEEIVPSLIENIIGVSIPTEYTTLVTILVMVVAISAIDQAVQRFFPGKNIKNLKSELKAKQKILADLVGKSEEEIELLVASNYREQPPKRIVQSALDFFLPSQQDGGVLIQGAGTSISKEAIKEVPRELDYLIEDSSITQELTNVVVDIHRADRDSNESGWRGIVKEVSDKKIRLQLSPAINSDELYGTKLVTADVIVVSEKQLNGDLRPMLIHIMKINENLA